MGMAASQARLLTITARMHDVEYKAQSIQNAKIQLSTQSDQVYQEYLEALDATTLTVDDINGNTITANFNNSLKLLHFVIKKTSLYVKDVFFLLLLKFKLIQLYIEHFFQLFQQDF